eukprot:TRINITY_DN14590_c0_g3_i2.p2 TRINITY_DN14590_c0_g3~~TRINITY_DN14590_c0_g3_i2.p2  ORF type:complete len:368 (+),score=33.30 TRINITY_DN14590_c0_g3_i2:300-1403(+)
MSPEGLSFSEKYFQAFKALSQPISTLSQWMYPVQDDDVDFVSVPYATHPQQQIIAIADGINEIRVLAFVDVQDVGGAPALEDVQTLNNQLQYKINCMEWDPQSKDMLAVGCQNYICIWKVSSVSGQYQSMDSMYCIALPQRFSGDVGCVQWASCGLLACVVQQPGFLLWRNWQCGGPCQQMLSDIRPTKFLKLSRTGKYLFVALHGEMIQIWCLEGWQNRSWTCKGCGEVVSASWGPNDEYVLLIFSDQLVILAFGQDKFTGDMLPLNLPQLCIEEQMNSIVDAEIDPTGKRLAIILKLGSVEGSIIALFYIQSMIHSNVNFIGYTKGPENGNCNSLKFFGRYKKGALLSVQYANESVISTYPLEFL